MEKLTAALLLRGAIVCGLAERNVRAGSDRGLGAVAAVERFARYDAVDFCSERTRSVLDGPRSIVRQSLTSQDVLEGQLNVARVKG